MYIWNHYLASALQDEVIPAAFAFAAHSSSSSSTTTTNSATAALLTQHLWVLPLVHGAFVQRRCSIFGRLLRLTLLARCVRACVYCVCVAVSPPQPLTQHTRKPTEHTPPITNTPTRHDTNSRSRHFAGTRYLKRGACVRACCVRLGRA